MNIKLHPADWFLAPWRRLPPLVPEPPRVFDKQRAFNDLKSMPDRIDQWHSKWCFNRAPDFWTTEETEFWLHAMIAMFEAQREASTDKEARKIAEQTLHGEAPPTIQLTKSAIANLGDYAVIPLIKMHDWQTLTVLCEMPNLTPPPFVLAFRKFVLPYLEENQKEALRTELTARLPGRNHWRSNSFDVSALTFMCAALGMEEVVAPIVRSWTDGAFSSNMDVAFLLGSLSLLWGLGADDVREHFERLKLLLLTRDDMLAWIAHTEDSAPTPLKKCVLISRGKTEAEEKISALVSIKTAAVAPHIVELFFTSRAPAAARVWMDTFPEYTLAAAKEIARTHPDLKDRAMLLASSFSREQNAKHAAPAGEAPIWLAEQFALIRPSTRSRPPTWLNLSSLYPLIIDGYKLNDDQVHTLLSALRSSTTSEIAPFIQTLREKAEKNTFDWFLRDLFEKWLEAGANTKEKWMMLSFGLLGSDELVASLFPLMVEWRKIGLQQRAMLGLEAMRLRGSDATLMKINEIAHSDELRSLRTKASEYIDRIAADRNLTRGELEDRIVPHCGFVSGRSRILEYGNRNFEILISKELKPSILCPDGKTRPGLPDSNSKDDPEMVARAKAEWKTIKKELQSFAKQQPARLERAMIDQRTWSLTEFEQFIVSHPLLVSIAQQLLWQASEPDGAQSRAFRLTAEGGFADSNDRDLQIISTARISIAHPCLLNEQDITQWTAIFSDYKLIPPFAQLGRPTSRLTEDEAKGQQLSTFIGRKVEAVALPSFLEKQGWLRGPAIDGGYFFHHTRFFSEADVTAIIEYSGIFAGAPHESDDQKIEHCYFVKGNHNNSDPPGSRQAVVLGTVDPIALSEVLCDLRTLTTRYQR
ncbi:MAG: DUF4132 domain-containing protein [Candidatus Obscuribacterales bacterium]|nr:DUF4132 domain-containing protein [Candidatus Obscuribacterales bacterium]